VRLRRHDVWPRQPRVGGPAGCRARVLLPLGLAFAVQVVRRRAGPGVAARGQYLAVFSVCWRCERADHATRAGGGRAGAARISCNFGDGWFGTEHDRSARVGLECRPRRAGTEVLAPGRDTVRCRWGCAAWRRARSKSVSGSRGLARRSRLETAADRVFPAIVRDGCHEGGVRRERRTGARKASAPMPAR